jgi:hypothetical protein
MVCRPGALHTDNRGSTNVGSSTQTIILSSPRPPAPHLGDAEKSVPAAGGANVFAYRGFVLPEKRSFLRNDAVLER